MSVCVSLRESASTNSKHTFRSAFSKRQNGDPIWDGIPRATSIARMQGVCRSESTALTKTLKVSIHITLERVPPPGDDNGDCGKRRTRWRLWETPLPTTPRRELVCRGVTCLAGREKLSDRPWNRIRRRLVFWMPVSCRHARSSISRTQLLCVVFCCCCACLLRLVPIQGCFPTRFVFQHCVRVCVYCFRYAFVHPNAHTFPKHRACRCIQQVKSFLRRENALHLEDAVFGTVRTTKEIGFLDALERVKLI